MASGEVSRSSEKTCIRKTSLENASAVPRIMAGHSDVPGSLTDCSRPIVGGWMASCRRRRRKVAVRSTLAFPVNRHDSEAAVDIILGQDALDVIKHAIAVGQRTHA